MPDLPRRHAGSSPAVDVLLRADAIHTLVPGRPAGRAMAVRDARIVAVSTDPRGLNYLAAPNTF